MKRPRNVGSGDKKKAEVRPSAPRPGTMAHLQYVEKQKRAKMGERKPSEAAASGPAGGAPAEAAGVGEDQRSLTQRVDRDKIGVSPHVVIHGAALAAAAIGGGLAQVPVSGALVITPIQISMIITLGSLHGKTLDKSGALAVLATATGPYAGRSISQLLIGWLPGVGNAINAATAFVITESIGWAANRILSND